MHFFRLRTLALVTLFVTTLLSSSACSKLLGPEVSYPDVAAVQATDIGSALKTYGYTPVVQRGDQIVFVVCDTLSLSQCNDKKDELANDAKPNVYVNARTGKIICLEGPHVQNGDDRNYYVVVPDGPYQDFTRLSAEQQQTLLGVMPQVISLIGKPSDSGDQTLMLAIGQTKAYVAYA